MKGFTYHCLDSETNYLGLLRHLTNQPEVVPPDVGPPKTLPPVEHLPIRSSALTEAEATQKTACCDLI